jgi:cobyrinic acid a,c-diamide synthase
MRQAASVYGRRRQISMNPMKPQTQPRLVIAGLAGDSGKTIVSLSLIAALRRKGITTTAFKKGPDFIDSAWLTQVSGNVARNLDVHLMGADTVCQNFMRHAAPDGISVIEGNRGLYDGMETGDNSTAELAKLLKAPVVLVCRPHKTTRTLAAQILGCQHFDESTPLAGIILNGVAGKRQEAVLRRAIAENCGLPVLGVIPKLQDTATLPDRHLGLVPPQEMPDHDEHWVTLAEIGEKYLELDQLQQLAQQTELLPDVPLTGHNPEKPATVRIGYFSDSAFTFYYPENLEALSRAGAELVGISAQTDTALPEIDALYIGGGFPETHAVSLERNTAMRLAIRGAATAGLPIYAECGGLIYLAESLKWQGHTYHMTGVFPIDIEMHTTPQGHGYSEFTVDRGNPFFPIGTTCRGHEFHYSSIVSGTKEPQTVCTVSRGSGSIVHRDGLVFKNVLASYTHLHACGTPAFATGLVGAAVKYRAEQQNAFPNMWNSACTGSRATVM